MIWVRQAALLVMRAPGRAALQGIASAIAAALFASVVLFGVASGATLTRRAVAGVAVDAQVVLAPGADATAAARIAAADPAVQATLPFDLVHFDAASLDRAGVGTSTSVGVIVGVDPRYEQQIHLFSASQGSQRPGTILMSRDLATNLGAVPGDRLSFALPGGGTVVLPTSGIVDITGADLILGPVDAAHRSVGANPPANVAVLDRATLQSLVLPKVPGAAVAHEAGAGGPAGAAVLAPEPAARRELHLRYDHEQLPGDPVEAQRWLDGVRHRLERAGGGAFQVADDASASLEPVAGDLAWGQILFLFLGLPGVLIALGLSGLSAAASVGATQRQGALLRARGATERQLAAILLTSGAIVAAVGSLVGALFGVLLAWLLVSTDLSGADPLASALRVVAIAVVVVTGLTVAANAVSVRASLRDELIGARMEVRRTLRPLWQRFYLDLAALIGGTATFLLVNANGLHPVLNAEGNPTVTLALTAFVAPLLFWVGGSLLLLRLMGAVARRSRGRATLARLLGVGGELAARSVAARPAAASRAIVLLALAVSFAGSVLVFDATYRQQQRVDAELTLGADFKAVSSQPVEATAAAAAAGPGISSTTPFVDRVVYVGPEAQDFLGVDPATLPATSPLSDTFFQGTTAGQAMAALQANPDAILVSAETAKDYSIVPGDRIRLQAPDAKGNLVSVDFHMAGVALEFPTAPKDAFLVGNLSYLAQKTGDARISFLLARAEGEAADASGKLTSRLGPGWQVSDLGTTNARLANSITSVDLRSLVIIDVLFALLIASVGVMLFLLAGIVERRRELATLSAIGAEPAQLRAELAGETLVVAAAGMTAGLVTAAVVGSSLLTILAGIFDPPPQFPAVPLGGLLWLVLGVAVGLGGATAGAARAVSRLDVLPNLRER